MNKDYAEQAAVYSETLLKPVAVWRDKVSAKTYGFPLMDPWGGAAYPEIDNVNWEFRGVLPAGTPVSDVRHDQANRVRCRAAGTVLFTADSVVSP